MQPRGGVKKTSLQGRNSVVMLHFKMSGRGKFVLWCEKQKTRWRWRRASVSRQTLWRDTHLFLFCYLSVCLIFLLFLFFCHIFLFFLVYHYFRLLFFSNCYRLVVGPVVVGCFVWIFCESVYKSICIFDILATTIDIPWSGGIYAPLFFRVLPSPT